MDDIVWFPVSEEEKEALERLCTLQGIAPGEWFRQVLRASEQGIVPFWQKSTSNDERKKGQEQEAQRDFGQPEVFNAGEAAR